MSLKNRFRLLAIPCDRRSFVVSPECSAKFLSVKKNKTNREIEQNKILRSKIRKLVKTSNNISG